MENCSLLLCYRLQGEATLDATATASVILTCERGGFLFAFSSLFAAEQTIAYQFPVRHYFDLCEIS